MNIEDYPSQIEHVDPALQTELPFQDEFMQKFPGTTFTTEPPQDWYLYNGTIKTQLHGRDQNTHISILVSDPTFLEPLSGHPCTLERVISIDRLAPILAHIPDDPTPLLYNLSYFDALYHPDRFNRMIYSNLPVVERPQILAESLSPLHTTMTHAIHSGIGLEGYLKAKTDSDTDAAGHVFWGIKHAMNLFEAHCTPQTVSNELINSLFTFQGSEQGIIKENIDFVKHFYELFFRHFQEHLLALTRSHRYLNPNVLGRIYWPSIRHTIMEIGSEPNGSLGLSGNGLEKNDIELVKDESGIISVKLSKDRKERMKQWRQNQNDNAQTVQDIINVLAPHKDRVFLDFANKAIGLSVSAQRYCPLASTKTVPPGSNHMYGMLTEIAIESFKYGVTRK